MLGAQLSVGQYDPRKEELEKAGATWKEIKDKQFTSRLQAENKLVASGMRKETILELFVH